MANIIIGLSKYIIIILMAVYTFSCFSVFAQVYEDDKKWILIRQNIFMFLIQFTAYLVMYLQERETKLLAFYGVQVVFMIGVLVFYRIFYPKASRLVVNNMCMLLTIGFIMITRLTYSNAVKQFVFALMGIVIGLIVPVIIRRIRIIQDWMYIYAGVGILALGAVAVLGKLSGGAKLGFTIAGFGIQPSEFVKILFVFYVAASLNHATSFKNVIVTTVIAATHVLILVLSTDLGAALIMFVVYLVMLYVATRQPLYAIAGIAGGSVAAMVGYRLFSHIQVRVSAWQDPFASYSTGGYQVAQSLFAIGTGSWFGMGLYQGLPDSIPVSDTDFIFSAISEEMGLVFALCLVLVCISCYVMFLNIAMAIRNQFYKLIALGLGTCYIFQVFLTIGGVTKFIPSTGVTLPLVSYGGSSMLSTMIMFGIIQGLYVLREDEEEIIEKRRENEIRRSGKRRTAKEQRKKSKEQRSKKFRNKEFARVTYLFVGLFLALMSYMVYFNIVEAKTIVNSPYNERQDAFANRVIRGNITDKNGNILAQTNVSEDGSEYRDYPYGNVFSHVVGYSYPSTGKSGVESIANFDLLTSNAFFVEKFLNEFKNEKNMGNTVVTTLDAELQQAAYNAMGENKGAVIIMEASTGKILTMLSTPSFNPNTVETDWGVLNAEGGDSPLLNRVTQGQYAPGSTFKIVTALEYMKENHDYSNYLYDCQGEITVEGTTIRCFNNTVHGLVDLRSSMAHSCNSSFSNIGLALDKSKYRTTAEELLFNQNLPSVFEYSKGSFQINDTSSAADVMMTAMGQGETLVSPYHMALITASIANGGTLMEPYLVERVTNYAGSEISKNIPKSYRKLMATEEATQLKEYMKAVVDEGTANVLGGQSYTVAGKTGTAEYSIEDGEKTHSWFVGFSNVDNPDLVISVIVEGYDGNDGAKAVPIAKQILDSYYY